MTKDQAEQLFDRFVKHLQERDDRFLRQLQEHEKKLEALFGEFMHYQMDRDARLDAREDRRDKVIGSYVRPQELPTLEYLRELVTLAKTERVSIGISQGVLNVAPVGGG